MAEKHCFQARWANFFAEMPLDGPRRANFFAEVLLEGLRGASFFAPTDAPRFCRWHAPSTPVAVGVLHYMKPLRDVSSACRTLM